MNVLITEYALSWHVYNVIVTARRDKWYLIYILLAGILYNFHIKYKCELFLASQLPLIHIVVKRFYLVS